MAKGIHYAVYILNARRKHCVLATKTPLTDRAAVAASPAAQRQGAFILSGLLTELPPTLTMEEVTQRTGLAVPGTEPIATD